MRPEAEPWWRQAKADLAAARDNLTLGHWYLVSWLVHQAAEKALKSLHIERTGTMPPQTHNLVHLGLMLAVPADVERDLGYLNPALDLVRYPDPRGRSAPVDQITEAIASRDLEFGTRVVEWCKQELGL